MHFIKFSSIGIVLFNDHLLKFCNIARDFVFTYLVRFSSLFHSVVDDVVILNLCSGTVGTERALPDPLALLEGESFLRLPSHTHLRQW